MVHPDRFIPFIFLARPLQKQHYFRIKNTEKGHFMSVQGGMEEMKSGRVVVTPEVEPMSDIWFHQDGFIKNKVRPSLALETSESFEKSIV